MTDQAGSPSRPRRWLTEAIALAAAPLLGYFYAFAYEYGFLSYFGLPYWLVQVGIPQVALVASLACIVTLILYTILRALPRAPYWVLLDAIASVAFPIAVLVPIVLTTNWTSGLNILWTVSSSLLLFYGALHEFIGRLLRPLYVYQGTLLDRWKQEAIKRLQEPDIDAFSSIVDRAIATGRVAAHHPLLVWGLLIALPGLAFTAGRSTASIPGTWFVRTTPPPCVVIRQYESGLICVQLSRSRRAILPRFEILPLSSAPAFEKRVMPKLRAPVPLP